jgi:hypothetical protein
VGLTYPRDLDAWHAWQRSRTPLRTLRNRFRSEPPLLGTLTLMSSEPRLLVVLDWLAPTALMALFEMTRHLSTPYAVLAPQPIPGMPLSTTAQQREITVDPAVSPTELGGVQVVVAAGHYLPLGAAGYAWSRLLSAEFVAVQHGLLTPHAPPLAPDSHLLAWSGADADFWRSGRLDVQARVVGSQLLWEAGAGSTHVTHDRPTFLGQLHSAEVGRRAMARFTGRFCRTEGARYRPHPGERDRLSRWQHARWRRQGIRFDDGSVPLRELPAPVVSVFSTGILEAAARGVPAWAAYDDPPAWLSEFWERYDMSRYGSAPTPAPARPEQQPAVTVAADVEAML